MDLPRSSNDNSLLMNTFRTATEAEIENPTPVVNDPVVAEPTAQFDAAREGGPYVCDRNLDEDEHSQSPPQAPPEETNSKFKNLVNRIIKKLATQKCLAYEETQLDKKYPEFKSLMREYDEGILLFEVIKQLVWDKASNDEEGLNAFYDTNKGNFKWKKRANVTFYILRTDDKKLIKKIQCKAKNKSVESLKGMFNKEQEIVQSTSGIYEEGKNEDLDKLKWKSGSMNKGYGKNGSFFFTKIEEIVEPTIKTLDEARGYVVADYQDNLEKELIKKLKEKFKVEINEKVFKSLVK